MIVGVPAEIKDNENRISMVPAGVLELTRAGHTVYVQKGAGVGSGIADEDYAEAGANIVERARDVWDEAELIIKVKEPQEAEWRMIRKDHTLFTYFHFAADKKLTDAMAGSGATCVSYETLRDSKGRLPLLTPMSEVAGRMSIQEGAKYLEKPMMGRGILLSGVPGVEPAEVVILGGGIVGANAARIAAGLGANVTILDIDLDRLRYLSEIMPANVTTIYSNRYNILDYIKRADLLIGAVLIPGARAPRLVSAEDLKLMKHGAVIIDVAVDQGGCVETCRPTTHSNPTYVVEGVVHYCVANMPGAVGRTSTYALTNATMPWALRLAKHGAREAGKKFPELACAIDVIDGLISERGIAEAFNYEYVDISRIL